MILIDGSSLTYKTYHGNKKEIIKSGNFEKSYFTHLLLSAILWKSKSLGASKHNRVVICSDSKPYWRTKYFDSVKTEYFKDYYLNEKTQKEIDVDNWKYKGKRVPDEYSKFVWETHTDVIQFLNDNTDFIEIKVKEAEADDIIAVLSKYYANLGEEIFIVAGDKDFKQLLNNPKIHIYNDNPFRKANSSEFMEVDDPVKFLETHIMSGDASDNLPNIKPKLGEKTAIKLYEDRNLFEELLNSNPSIKFRYEVNRNMIDFNYIPKDIQSNILSTYFNYIKEDTRYNELAIMNYLFNNKLSDLQSRMKDFMMVDYIVETRLNTYFDRTRKNKKFINELNKRQSYMLDNSDFEDLF